jgi:ribonuclease HII
MLKTTYSEIDTTYDIGIDEAGRGPLFGRVYAAAVILPKINDPDVFDFSRMKDSKKFTSKKKLLETAQYIKENAVSWAVAFEDENTIDNINILQATQSAMHQAIGECRKNAIDKMNTADTDYFILVDGNYFNSYIKYDKEKQQILSIPHMCVKGGDNTYACIAAASILAKTERDAYIEKLCDEHTYLDEYYSLRGNKGYGAKKHMEGINIYGITKWHRKSFAPCKEKQLIDLNAK